MTLMDCAVDSNRTYQTLLRWVKEGKFKTKKIGMRETYVEPAVWEKFCTDNNIKRKGE